MRVAVKVPGGERLCLNETFSETVGSPPLYFATRVTNIMLGASPTLIIAVKI